MPLSELYNKSGFGRRLRKISAATAAGLVKIFPQMWSSRVQDGKMTFIGPNISVTGSNGVSIGTIPTAAKFAGPPSGTRVYAKVGSWPGWLTLNTSTGDITGTAATGTTNNLRVSCTVTGFGSDQSNLFNVVIP